MNINPLILEVNGTMPQWGRNCYFAPNSTIVGDVVMGNDCSVWFQAVIRGDVNKIRIGNQVNIQDGTILHCTYQTADLSIGDNVSIGHRAIVHGCTLESNILIGMGAIIMDHAHVKSNALIAAGSIVLENTICESYTIYAGIPAKPIKVLDPHTYKETIERIGKNYVMYASWFMK